MSVDDARDQTEPTDTGGRRGHGRVGRTLSGWRALGRIAYRDPEHIAERLVLNGARTLGDPSLEWARRVRDERQTSRAR